MQEETDSWHRLTTAIGLILDAAEGGRHDVAATASSAIAWSGSSTPSSAIISSG